MRANESESHSLSLFSFFFFFLGGILTSLTRLSPFENSLSTCMYSNGRNRRLKAYHHYISNQTKASSLSNARSLDNVSVVGVVREEESEGDESGV